MNDSVALAIRASQIRQSLPTEQPEQVILKTIRTLQPETKEEPIYEQPKQESSNQLY